MPRAGQGYQRRDVAAGAHHNHGFNYRFLRPTAAGLSPVLGLRWSQCPVTASMPQLLGLVPCLSENRRGTGKQLPGIWIIAGDGVHYLAHPPIRPRSALRAHHAKRDGLVAIRLPEQLRQPRDVDGDPSSFVVREHLCLSGISLGLPTVEIRERLTGGVADDIAAGHLVSATSTSPGWSRSITFRSSARSPRAPEAFWE